MILLSEYADIDIQECWHWVSNIYCVHTGIKGPVNIITPDGPNKFLVKDLKGVVYSVTGDVLDISIPDLGYVLDEQGQGQFLSYTGYPSYKKGLCTRRLCAASLELEQLDGGGFNIIYRNRVRVRLGSSILNNIFYPRYIHPAELLDILEASVKLRDSVVLPLSRNFAVYSHTLLRSMDSFENNFLCYRGRIISKGNSLSELFELPSQSLFLKEKLEQEITCNDNI